jgi:hypothetical protein
MQRKLLTIFLAFFLCILCNYPAQAKADAPYIKKVDEFFKILGKGEVGKAVDFIYQDNPWVKRKPDQIQEVRERLVGASKYVGKYLGHNLLNEKQVAGRFVQITYMVLYDRQPAVFSFRFYRPKHNWRTQGFSFNFDLYEMVNRNVEENLFK